MTTSAATPPQAATPPAAPAPAEYTLPEPRRAPRKGMPKAGMIIFTGLPKSGKNSLALSRPGLLLIETEKLGSEHLDGWVDEVADLQQFRRSFGAALKNPKCTAIGVSTFDKLLTWWQDELCAKWKVTSMSANIEGVNLWSELRKKVETFVETTKTCGKLIVVLGHYKEPKLDKEGRVVIAHNIEAPGKLGGYICGEAELIGALSKEKVGEAMQFKVSFEGGGQVGAYGGRVKELEGKTIVLPEGEGWTAIEAEANKSTTTANTNGGI